MSSSINTVKAPVAPPAKSPQGKPTSVPKVRVSRELLGVFFCLLAAIFYTGSNVSLRYLAGAQVSPVAVIFVKELVAVLALGPVLIYQFLVGRKVFVSLRVVVVLVLIGLAVQLLANLGQQWALGIIGLAVTSPAIFAAMLGSSALLGFVLLGERVSWQGLLAVLLVILAIVSLSHSVHGTKKVAGSSESPFHSEKAPHEAATSSSKTSGSLPQEQHAAGGLLQSPLRSHPPGITLLAIAVCCGAGVIYSLLGIAIRWARLQGATVESTVFLITLMGVVGLGPLLVAQVPWEATALDNPHMLFWMVLSGIGNLLGFAAITKGYQMTRVLYANMSNATQVAFGAVAGVVLFGEVINVWLLLGVTLTLAGVLLMGYTAARENHGPKQCSPPGTATEDRS
jgi:drug/metabolite transporter (DMT)-like permease